MALLQEDVPVMPGLWLRRWRVLVVVLTLDAMLFLLHATSAALFQDFWWGNARALWSTLAMVTAAGSLWSCLARRAALLRPMRSEPIILGAVAVACTAVALTAAPRG